VAGAIGRNEDGTGLIHEALVFDPLNPDVYQALGGVMSYEGDYDGAERAYRKSLEISPLFAGSQLCIGAARLFRGRPKEALPEIEAEPSSIGRDALLVATYFALGRKRYSDASLAQLLKTHVEDGSYWIAIAYALRKENDLAFEWLERAYASRELSLSTGRSDYFASLHGDPRWQQFLRQMNIPD